MLLKISKLTFVITLLFIPVFASGSSQNKSLHNENYDLSKKEVERFSIVLSQIKQFYVEDVNDRELFENAMRGMLEGLDPHSTYLDVEEYGTLKSNTSGNFGGLGIEIIADKDLIKIISPLDDTPAHKAGLKPGDYIVKIDNRSVIDMDLKDAVNMMRGKKDEKVKLTILRKGEKKPLKFNIKRDIIELTSVKSKLYNKHYGYLRISHFQEPSADLVRKEIKKLNKKSKNQLDGVIIDLRNNPGGLLGAAVDISDIFLDSKKLISNDNIVSTKARVPAAQFSASASPGDLLDGKPIVVLINEGSASASEIVAGALQDHNRAVVIGMKSFGKGSVQTVIPLDDETGVKLTTALYYTPKGCSIQAKGIVPDIVVDNIEFKKNEEAEDVSWLQESDFQTHLISKATDKEKVARQEYAKRTIKNKALAKEDYQLYQALLVLKGLHTAQASNY